MKKFKIIKCRRGDYRDLGIMTETPFRTVLSILMGLRNPKSKTGKKVILALSILEEARNTKIILKSRLSEGKIVYDAVILDYLD